MVYLDSAVCHRRSRATLLEAWSQSEAVYDVLNNGAMGEEKGEWLSKKKIKIASIVDLTPPSPLMSILISSTSGPSSLHKQH